MRTFFLSLGLIALALPAFAAEKQHDANDLKRVNITAINAETQVVFWNKNIVKVEVDGEEFPESVYINTSGGTLEISTSGPHAAVNVLIDECEGDDCGKRSEGAHMMFIHRGDGDGPVELNLDEIISNAGDQNVWVRKLDDKDGNVEIKEFIDEHGNHKIIVKRFKRGKEGADIEVDIDIESIIEGVGDNCCIDGGPNIMIIRRGADGDENVIVHELGEDDPNLIGGETRIENKQVIVRRLRLGHGEGAERRIEVKVGVRRSNAQEVASVTVYLPYRLRLTARTVNGTLTVKDGDGSRASVTTVNGEIRVENFKGNLTASTVSGALNVTGTNGSVRARTVSGSLSLQHVAGDVEARTVSGAIEMRDLGIDDLSARTHSGAIEHRGTLSDGGEYSVKTTSGKITFYLPAKASFNYDIDRFNGKVSGKDFKIPRNKGRIVGTVGRATPASPTIKVKTLSGKVKFVRE